MAVINDTPFVIHCGEQLTADGEMWLTLVKGTFALRHGATDLVTLPEHEARSVRAAFITWSDPITTPPKYPCDIGPLKRATDVIVVAKGYAPGHKPAPAFDVGVTVGALHKALRVFGLRVWQQRGAGLSSPRPLLEQEIRYDFAWGGLDASDLGDPVGDMKNPVGNGVVRDVAMLSDRIAPCIEDPNDPIRSVLSKPAPAGFGPLGPHWSPRREHAGSYDEAWLRDQAPLPPRDQDPRHFQCASPGLIADPPLTGGEPVKLTNLTPDAGHVMFALPKGGAAITHSIDGKAAGHFEPHIDTLVIDTLHVPEDTVAIVELMWRSLTPMPRRMADHDVLIRRRR
jgi:hypothetical protein